MSLPPPRRRTPPSDRLPVPPAVKTQSCGRQITPVPPSMDLTRRVASSARRSREEEANPSESAHSRGQYLAFLSSPSFRISRWVEALDSRSSRGLPARVMAPERHSCGAVSGALPAPVWPMHIASPLLLIPRTEPPLIQAQRGSLGRGSVAGQWRQTPLPLALVRLGFRRAPGCLLPVCSPAHGCALAPVYLRCSLDARRSLVLVWHGFPLGSSREDVAAAGLRVVGPGRGRLRGRRAGSCRSVQQPGSGWCPRRRSWGARSAAR